MSERTAWAVVAALLGAAAALAVLRRAPEPPRDADGFDKPRYREVVTRLFAAATLVAAAALAGAVAQARLSPPLLCQWVLLAAVGTPLALCDLRTTYLPQQLMRPWLLAAVTCCCWAVASQPSGHRSGTAARIAAAVVLGRGLFWLLWRFGAGIGFGDVRLAGVLAMPTAGISLTTWYLGLLSGTVVGALWGITTVVLRRRRPSRLGRAFPYGPALVVGAWVGLLLRIPG